MFLVRRKNLPEIIQNNLRILNSLNLKAPLMETDFIVFDTEATGFNVKKGDRLVSLSALRLREGRIDLADAFHALIDPNRSIPNQAAIIHGILPRMVIGKPTLGEILPSFLDYIGGSILVAHHAWLDMNFLNREMNRLYGFPIQNLVLDTVILEQALSLKKTPSDRKPTKKMDDSLIALANRYDVPMDERHSSFGDALVTAQIFQHMIKQAQRMGIVCLKDLLRLAVRSLVLIEKEVAGS